MADFISFNEGRKYLANTGLATSASGYLLLSKYGVSQYAVTDVLAGAVSAQEVTGTGYARKAQVFPTASSANPTALVFSQASWDTSTNTDWPSSVKSCVLVTSSDDTGKAICAWNLVAGETARDMSAAHTVENFTPSLDVA